MAAPSFEHELIIKALEMRLKPLYPNFISLKLGKVIPSVNLKPDLC